MGREIGWSWTGRSARDRSPERRACWLASQPDSKQINPTAFLHQPFQYVFHELQIPSMLILSLTEYLSRVGNTPSLTSLDCSLNQQTQSLGGVGALYVPADPSALRP